MFFPEKIKSIKIGSRVLEIGPGSNPHPRSDIYLERRFENETIELEQRGFATKTEYNRKVIYYNGGKFPFKDMEFDYIICSHVIEHIPENELSLFISEMERVSPMGYLEFPTVFYELINYQPVHKWLLSYKDSTILFLNKDKIKSNNIHKIFRDLFYSPQTGLRKLFLQYKNLFFTGLEWNGKINFNIIDDLDVLVDNYDYNKYRLLFSRKNNIKRKRSLINNRYVNKIKLIYLNNKNKIIKSGKISRSAKLWKKELIEIGNHSEIKDNVIISTHRSLVRIGEYSQINPFTVIYGGNGVFIGSNVMIAPHCMIAAGNHDYIQTDKPMRFAGSLSKGPIIIEDDVWIGANCTITDGVKIGKGAVVGANSLVNKNVSPYEVVGGVPAKFIKSRI